MKKKSSARERFSPLKLPRIRREDIMAGTRPLFLQLRQACIYGGFGRMKAYELIRARRIVAVRLGKKTMISVASIDRFHDSLPKLVLTDEASP
jgi:hypothetical protein